LKTIIEVMDDPKLFAPHFQPMDSWSAWRTFLKALFALPMMEDELLLYRQCTGRTNPPKEPFTEAWLPTGRRGGKSRILALIAVYLGCFRNYREFLSPGEVATVQILAADRKQARSIFRYAKGLIVETPLLLPLLEDETSEVLSLKNNVSIEITTSNFRTTRGYTCAACLCDEIAFWNTSEDSANEDVEVVNSVRHAMATIPGAILLCASSPYARRGALWNAFQDYFGKEEAPILVWKAATEVMNPAIPKNIIEAALKRDEPAARAEYFAEFRSDIEVFLSREAVEAVTIPGRLELPYRTGIRYKAFIDPSGGVKSSFTAALAFAEGEKALLALIREFRPPFNPEEVVKQICEILKAYGLRECFGDRWGSEWTVQRFAKNGIKYIHSDQSRSDIYLEILPAINSKRVELLDISRMRDQFVALERRTGRGADSIGPAPTQRDDVCNAAAGALVLAGKKKNSTKSGSPVSITQLSPHDVGMTPGMGSFDQGPGGFHDGFPVNPGGSGGNFSDGYYS
jgi:hypothetical protein